MHGCPQLRAIFLREPLHGHVGSHLGMRHDSANTTCRFLHSNSSAQSSVADTQGGLRERRTRESTSNHPQGVFLVSKVYMARFTITHCGSVTVSISYRFSQNWCRPLVDSSWIPHLSKGMRRRSPKRFVGSALVLVYSFPRVQVPNIQGLWFQKPFRVWLLEPKAVNIWYLDPVSLFGGHPYGGTTTVFIH